MESQKSVKNSQFQYYPHGIVRDSFSLLLQYNLSDVYCSQRWNVSTFLLFQVGSIPRSPQRRENGSVSNSSPDDGEIQEAEQLLADGSGECRRNNRQGRGILAKFLRLLKKLYSTHQFRNVQVTTFFKLKFLYKLHSFLKFL